MRWLAVILILAAPVTAGWAQARITVAQLQDFLSARHTRKQPDKVTAAELEHIALSERLTPLALRNIVAQSKIGPETAQALELLADVSQLDETPQSEWNAEPAPSPAQQHDLIAAATHYAEVTLRHLPDFVATRATRSFDNMPQSQGLRAKPIVRLHWARATESRIAFRAGREWSDDEATDNHDPAHNAFTTWGEFGPILRIVLTDSFQGSVAWSHWERDENGARIAVFHYTVPRTGSHYSIDFCCYQSEDFTWTRFHDKPAYHGDLFFNADSSEITGISLRAEFDDDSAMRQSGVAVHYGRVTIGDKTFLCPLQSVALSVVRNFAIMKLDRVGLEKHINLVTFRDYHKFGSTARIVEEQGTGGRK